MNWYIGQEIVCIHTHTQNAVVKDKIYIIKGIRQGCCHIQLDFGITFPDLTGSGLFHQHCNLCKKDYQVTTDNTWWIADRLFAPLMDISELESILNKEQIKEKI